MSGWVIWLTGLPGSGKSSLADGLKKRVPDLVILRMDELRRLVTPEPLYSETERDMVYRCIIYTAKKLSDLGHPVVIDATGNLRRWRDLARESIPGFAEIYLRGDIKVFMDRERQRKDSHGAPKDIYHKAKEGWPVPGVNAPYEEPLTPELILDNDRISVDEAVDLIFTFISSRFVVKDQAG